MEQQTKHLQASTAPQRAFGAFSFRTAFDYALLSVLILGFYSGGLFWFHEACLRCGGRP